jgi:hypothetical protein
MCFQAWLTLGRVLNTGQYDFQTGRGFAEESSQSQAIPDRDESAIDLDESFAGLAFHLIVNG